MEKVILFKKQLGESLGLGIAGGLGSLFGDLPVFVLDIKLGGRVHSDGRIKKDSFSYFSSFIIRNIPVYEKKYKGDLLMSINNRAVAGLRHCQVVELLKDVAKRETDIRIVVCEVPFLYMICDRASSF